VTTIMSQAVLKRNILSATRSADAVWQDARPIARIPVAGGEVIIVRACAETFCHTVSS
jgi:hypothetical protein